MYLKKIFLKNYRNLSKVFLNLNPNVNILVGANGQGKTNFLESIYLLGTGSSHRTNIDQELIGWEKKKTLIQVMLQKQEQDLKITIEIKGKEKKIKINDNPLEKVSDLIGNLNVVLFSPEDLKLVKGGPVNRRKFIDIEVSQVSSYYYHLSKKYSHVLKQRNNLLKEIRDRKSNSKKDMLVIWDKQLVEIGSKIIIKRQQVIKKLEILARLAQRQITDGNENLSINYENELLKESNKKNKYENKNKESLKLIFEEKLVNNRNREIKRGYTLIGPHRDDLLLKINEIDVRKYGSQGQQRTVALALKLAELEFMKSETGEYPILLLDDVFSELDKRRKSALFDIITDKIQTFITATEFNNLKPINFNDSLIFKVNKGLIEERKKKGEV